MMDKLPFDDTEVATGGQRPADWKWHCLFAAPQDLPVPLAGRWAAWSAQAMKAEDLAILGYWARRGNRAA